MSYSDDAGLNNTALSPDAAAAPDAAMPLTLFRCYPRLRGARRGRLGHWSYIPRPQFHGRWDNTDLYDSWYFSQSAVGAVAESFYNKRQWIPEVFLTPHDEPRAIAEFTYDGPPLLEFDNAATLVRLRMRPSQIVVQDLGMTQALARQIYEERVEKSGPASRGRGNGGLAWWSSQMPSETSVMLWGHDGEPPAGLKLVGIQALSIAHPAVIEAAARLFRPLG